MGKILSAGKNSPRGGFIPAIFFTRHGKSPARIPGFFVPSDREYPFGIPIAVHRGGAVISGLSERKEVSMKARRIVVLAAFFLVFGSGFRVSALPVVCGSAGPSIRTQDASPSVSDPFEMNDYIAGPVR